MIPHDAPFSFTLGTSTLKENWFCSYPYKTLRFGIEDKVFENIESFKIVKQEVIPSNREVLELDVDIQHTYEFEESKLFGNF